MSNQIENLGHVLFPSFPALSLVTLYSSITILQASGFGCGYEPSLSNGQQQGMALARKGGVADRRHSMTLGDHISGVFREVIRCLPYFTLRLSMITK